MPRSQQIEKGKISSQIKNSQKNQTLVSIFQTHVSTIFFTTICLRFPTSLLHGKTLCIASPRSTALDAEGGAHGRLADVRQDLLPQEGTQCLREPYGGGGFALTQRGGVDATDHHIMSLVRSFKNQFRSRCLYNIPIKMF